MGFKNGQFRIFFYYCNLHAFINQLRAGHDWNFLPVLRQEENKSKSKARHIKTQIQNTKHTLSPRMNWSTTNVFFLSLTQLFCLFLFSYKKITQIQLIKKKLCLIPDFDFLEKDVINIICIRKGKKWLNSFGILLKGKE